MTVTLDVLPLASVTVTPPGGAGVVKLTGKETDWFVPTMMPLGKLIAAEPAAMLVSWKLAVRPPVEAVTVYEPATELAVKGAVATPAALVTTLVPPLKEPLGPLAGAVNTTVTPDTGFPLALRTVAVRGAAKGVFTVVLCGVPPVEVMLAGGPGLFVRLNVAGVATPVTEAETL